jgi:hypothetical protein
MNDEVVDIFLNANTCLICRIIIKKGEIYCRSCKKLVEGFNHLNRGVKTK